MDRVRLIVALALVVGGFVVAVAGVWLLSPPVALIVAGVTAAVAGALAINIERGASPRR